MKIVAAGLTLLLGLAGTALADGKFFASERGAVGIPYQRAVLFFWDGKETLLLQSEYQTSSLAEPGTALGWVVPTPSIPTLAATSGEEQEQDLFFWLNIHSQPDVEWLPGPITACILGFPVMAIWTFVTLARLISPIDASSDEERKKRRGAIAAAFAWRLVVTLVLGLVAIGVPNYSSSPQVEVIGAERVGVYDTQIVRSNDSAALIEWLNQHGFRFDRRDSTALERYVRDGWCFATATVRPSERASATARRGGMTAPLILRFASAQPVYPLALTATAGTETEVLVYVLTDRKQECDGRLPLRFAGPFGSEGLAAASTWRSPHGPLFGGWETELGYLCKFRGILTPAQMQEDLVFRDATNPADYHETVRRWQ